MNNLLHHSKLFLKRNASTILTCVGGVGVVTAAVLAAKETPKALRLIEQAEKNKGEELTKLEKVKVAGPAYIPAIIAGATTLACIFGANTLNKRQQAALMSAYAFLDNSYKEYKKKVEELYGEEADARIVEAVAKNKYEKHEPSGDGETQLFFDNFSMRYFESTMADVIKAEYEVNKTLQNEYYVNVNEFYEHLGIPPMTFTDVLGWSIGAGGAWYGYSWIDFEHEKVVMDDGLECTIITMSHEPAVDYLYYV